jgi:hypothetical protein
MGRTLSGADHKRGKIDELFVMLSRPSLIPNYSYRGYPCPKGHELRHKHHHWCIQCAANIVSNKCGMELNHVDLSHSGNYIQFFNSVAHPLNHNDCWIVPDGYLNCNDPKTPKLTALTYRTGHLGVSQTVTLSRFIYSYFWGDVGSLTVKRTCKTPNCWNPLHMKSIFNIQEHPTRVSPLNLSYDSVKNIQYNKDHLEGRHKLIYSQDSLQTLLSL